MAINYRTLIRNIIWAVTVVAASYSGVYDSQECKKFIAFRFTRERQLAPFDILTGHRCLLGLRLSVEPLLQSR